MKWHAIIIASLIAGLATSSALSVSNAQNPLRDRQQQRVEAPDIAEFYRADGRRGFILDRREAIWVLLPNTEDEALALAPQRAPGGATAFVTDWGHELLRVSPIGGLTYYPEDQPNGVIAEAFEEARPIDLPEADVNDLREASQQAAIELAELFERPIQVEYGAAPREGLGLMVEAMSLTIVGIRVALDEGADLSSLQRIRVNTGESANLSLEDDVLTITINPLGGIPGRPSSMRISRYVVSATTPA